MSDEEIKRSMGSAIEPPSVGGSEFTPTPDPTPLNENEGLRKKLRLYDEEELEKNDKHKKYDRYYEIIAHSV